MRADASRAAADERHNLFFALLPDEAVRARMAAVVAELERTLAPRGRWIKSHRYHLTLEFLGEHAALPAPLVQRALAAGARVSTGPFEIVLDRVGSFGPGGQTGWLGCSAVADGLRTLARELAQALRTNRFDAGDPARRVPHVTVLRDAAQPLATVLPEAVRWPVDGFALVDSSLQPPGPYRVLGAWQLR